MTASEENRGRFDIPKLFTFTLTFTTDHLLSLKYFYVVLVIFFLQFILKYNVGMHFGI